MLQGVVVCCSGLYCVLVTSTLCVAGYCRVLLCVAVWCSVLQCIAMRCSVLQCVCATNTLCVAGCCTVLQCVVVCFGYKYVVCCRVL